MYLVKFMSKKNQSSRLTFQHKASQGVIGIFGDEARLHDKSVGDITILVKKALETQYPKLSFRHRTSVYKNEINEYLNKIDQDLGQTLFVKNSSIKPDGGILEVKDDLGSWRIVLVAEAKHQGKDITNIGKGILVGTGGNQDLMAAGNAIERSHKNIAEIANFMLKESHFPYVLFLDGSNFLTKTVTICRPDGRNVTLDCNSGMLNRLDRLTAANYGMKINTNLCKNKFISHGTKAVMLQAASIFTPGDGQPWDKEVMFDIMYDISITSLQILGSDLFHQLTNPETE